MLIEKLQGKSTGIGSLPYGEEGAALSLIWRHLPVVPHWPQLPLRSSEEGFVRQYLGPLVQAGLLEADGNRQPRFLTDDPQWEARLVEYYEMVLAAEQGMAALDNFAFPRESAAGFYSFIDFIKEQTGPHINQDGEAGSSPDSSGARDIIAVKGHLSGPVTVGMQITAADGSPAFYREELREIIVKTLSCQARWQVKKLRETGWPVVLFIDDPGIYGYGTSGYVGLGRAAIQDSLREIITNAREEQAVVGVHCCAGVDWSLLFELSPDIVNFDAYSYFSSMLVYTGPLHDFLKNGGILAWGIVPTSEKIEEESGESLQKLLSERINALAARGVDGELLKKQLMITPSCGATTLTVPRTEKVYRLAGEFFRNI